MEKRPRIRYLVVERRSLIYETCLVVESEFEVGYTRREGKMNMDRLLNIATELKIKCDDVEELEKLVYMRLDVAKASLEASEKVRIACDAKADEVKVLFKSDERRAQEMKFDEVRLKLFTDFEDLAIKHGVEPLRVMFREMHRATSSLTEEEFANAIRDMSRSVI